MARQLRIQFSGALYHITSRGNEKKDIFQRDDDRGKFLTYLKEAKERYRFLLYAYALMNNHYHLLIETPLANIAQIMHYINTSYTVYFNRKNRRYGHLFQGRYKAILVDKDNYLLELSRYIHLNPVRANLVTGPEDYRWSSYRDYIQVTDGESGLAEVESILGYFSSEAGIDKYEYRRFVEEGLEAALTERPRSGTPPTFRGEQRAQITALACSDPPEGHARWSLRLLADKSVELGIVDSISHDTVSEILKKTMSNRT